MAEIYFFDLPVYRLEHDLYYKKQEKEIESYISDMKRGTPNYMPSEAFVINIQQSQYEKYGPWTFNEIIGYIRLHFLGSQIRGEYFSAEKKRNVLSRHKVFTYKTHKLAPEITIRDHTILTNSEIFIKIQEYIADCKRELAKGRFLDDSVFMNIGPHVNWRSILNRERI